MKVTEQSKLYARKALKYIEKHPEQHDQENWFIGSPGHCGTTMCVAGTVNFLRNGANAIPGDSGPVARRILGLTLGESEAVFMEMDEERAKAKLAKIAAGEQFVEADYYRASSSGAEPSFDSYAWDNRGRYGN